MFDRFAALVLLFGTIPKSSLRLLAKTCGISCGKRESKYSCAVKLIERCWGRVDHLLNNGFVYDGKGSYLKTIVSKKTASYFAFINDYGIDDVMQSLNYGSRKVGQITVSDGKVNLKVDVDERGAYTLKSSKLHRKGLSGNVKLLDSGLIIVRAKGSKTQLIPLSQRGLKLPNGSTFYPYMLYSRVTHGYELGARELSREDRSVEISTYDPIGVLYIIDRGDGFIEFRIYGDKRIRSPTKYLSYYLAETIADRLKTGVITAKSPGLVEHTQEIAFKLWERFLRRFGLSQIKLQQVSYTLIIYGSRLIALPYFEQSENASESLVNVIKAVYEGKLDVKEAFKEILNRGLKVNYILFHNITDSDQTVGRSKIEEIINNLKDLGLSSKKIENLLPRLYVGFSPTHLAFYFNSNLDEYEASSLCRPLLEIVREKIKGRDYFVAGEAREEAGEVAS